VVLLGTAHLFVKVHRSGDSEVTFSYFEPSCLPATCYYQSNNSSSFERDVALHVFYL